MTRRERLEHKLERRREWADQRRDTATALLNRGAQFRGDIAFNTQPGHIPERARIIAAHERGFENLQVAEHHDHKAAGLAEHLDRAIFSDDRNALDALQQRIAENEAKRDRMKLINSLYRKGDAAKLADLGIDIETLKAKLAAAGPYWGSCPHLPYELTNLGARIRTDKERLKAIESRQQRTADAEAAGGVTISDHGEYCRVTFAEKPERDILNALRAAGFYWGAGSWTGQRTQLPAVVAELTAAPVDVTAPETLEVACD